MDTHCFASTLERRCLQWKGNEPLTRKGARHLVAANVPPSMLVMSKLPKMSVFLAQSLTISSHIVTRKLLEISGLKSLVIFVYCAHYSRPGLLKNLDERIEK